MLVSARIKLAAGKVQIAAQVVNLGERAVVGGEVRRRLGFRQRSEGVVDLGKQPVGRGDSNQGANAVLLGAAIGKRAAIGFERLPPSAGVKLEIAHRIGNHHGEMFALEATGFCMTAAGRYKEAADIQPQALAQARAQRAPL